MTDSTDSAKAVTAFSLLTGLAGTIAIIAISAKYGEKKVDTGSLIMATTIGFLGTIVGMALIREGK